MKIRAILYSALSVVPLTAACALSPTEPSTTTETITTFSSTLPLAGSASQTWTIVQSETVGVTLTALGGVASVGLGIGTPTTGGCDLRSSVTAVAGTDPQIVMPLDAGVYCVRVFDVGNLTASVQFSITVSKGATIPTATTPAATVPTVTDTFAGSLPSGGSSVYSFTVSQDGTVSVTLASVTGAGVPSTVHLRLGLGTFTDTTCNPTTSVDAQAGSTPQITTTSASGLYCLQLSDPGNLANPATFTITVTHP